MQVIDAQARWQGKLGYFLSRFILLCHEVRDSTLKSVKRKILLIRWLWLILTPIGPCVCIHWCDADPSLYTWINNEYQVCLTLVSEYLRTRRDLQLLLNFKISWIFNYQLLGLYIDLRIHGDLVNDYSVL